jgi:hypothetical protein
MLILMGCERVAPLVGAGWKADADSLFSVVTTTAIGAGTAVPSAFVAPVPLLALAVITTVAGTSTDTVLSSDCTVNDGVLPVLAVLPWASTAAVNAAMVAELIAVICIVPTSASCVTVTAWIVKVPSAASALIVVCAVALPSTLLAVSKACKTETAASCSDVTVLSVTCCCTALISSTEASGASVASFVVVVVVVVVELVVLVLVDVVTSASVGTEMPVTDILPETKLVMPLMELSEVRSADAKLPLLIALVK